MDRQTAEQIIERIRSRPFIEGTDYRWEERDGQRVQVLLRYPDPPTEEEIEAMRTLGLLA